MNKYLEKIAEEYSDDRYSANLGVAGAHLLTGGLAAMGGNYVGSKPILASIQQKGNVDKGTLRKILRDNKDLEVTFSAHKAAKGTKYDAAGLKVKGHGPYFIHKDHPDLGINPLKKSYIHGDKTKNLDVIMHELGHARASKLGKYQLPASKVQTHSDIGSMVGTVMLAHPTTAGAAWVAPLASSAPILYSEGLANHHGYKMVAKHGGKSMANRFLRGVAAKNMLGYAGAGLANSAYLYGLHRLAKSTDNK